MIMITRVREREKKIKGTVKRGEREREREREKKKKGRNYIYTNQIKRRVNLRFSTTSFIPLNLADKIVCVNSLVFFQLKKMGVEAASP